MGLMGDTQIGLMRFRANLAKRIAPGYGFNIYSQAVPARQGLMDAQGDLREMVRAFRSIVFACVNVRAKAVASAGSLGKFKVKMETGQAQYEDVPLEHPLVKLLRTPNPYFTRWYMWYLTVAYLDLTGNSYWWASRDRMRVPRTLWPLPSDRVKIVPGDSQRDEPLIKGYTVDWGLGNVQPMDADDVVHLRHPNPSDPYFYGLSLLMRAAAEADIDWFITAHQREFFANDAVPPAVITFPTILDKYVRKEFEEQWLTKYKRKPGQIGYLEGGATINMLQNVKEMDYLQSGPDNRKKIQAVFGVPDSKLMLIEHITARATLESFEYNFQKETVEPLLTMIDEQLTIDLAKPLFDERLIVLHESTIPKDDKLQAELDQMEIDMGKTSINEIRVRDGQDPFPGGDEPLVAFNLVPLSSTGVPKTPAAEPVPVSEPPKAKMLPLTETVKAAVWTQHERRRMKWERHMTLALKRGFNVIRKQVAERARRAQKDLEADAFDFNIEEWIKVLRPIVSTEVLAMIRDAFETFVRENSIDGVMFSPRLPGVVEGVGQLAAKTRTIAESLKADLQKQLLEAIEKNETAEQLVERVGKFFDATTDWRAKRIARTNSNFALNKGNSVAATESGLFADKFWITQRDDLVRDIHRVMDGISAPAEGGIFTLPNGDQLEMPGDPQAQQAQSIINCRCSVFYGTKGEEAP
jgi:HK97 family phage portal protein